MTEPGKPAAPAAAASHSGWRNWGTLAGAILASGSLFAFFLLFALDLMGKGKGNPYLGILCYVVAPSFRENEVDLVDAHMDDGRGRFVGGRGLRSCRSRSGRSGGLLRLQQGHRKCSSEHNT